MRGTNHGKCLRMERRDNWWKVTVKGELRDFRDLEWGERQKGAGLGLWQWDAGMWTV